MVNEMKMKDGMVQDSSAKTLYGKKWDDLFSFVTNEQLNDVELWKLLIRPYVTKSDDADEGWRGEYWGKLMRGASMVYAYSQDESLYTVLTQAVEGLLATQEENGRFSSYSQSIEFSGWDMWSRKYVMLGMQYFYEVCKDESLKECIVCALQKHADYIMERIGMSEGKIQPRKTSLYHDGYNAFSILQPFVKMYALTNEKRYLTYAKEMIDSEFSEGKLFALALENKLAPHEYPVKKAYEIMSCFEGLLEYYEIVGEESYLRAAQNYADRVLKTDFAIIGASGGLDEYFDNSTKTQVLKTEVNKFETCVTVTLMKFIATLYRLTGEKRYMDAIERAFFNAYLGALIDVKNVGGVAVPLFYSYSPVYQNERWVLMGGGKNISSYARFGCCIAIGAAGLGVIPKVGVTETSEGISVGLFLDGMYELSTCKLCIETEYPYNGRVKISLLQADGAKKVKIRIPDWCEKYALDKAHTQENGYACVEMLAGETVAFEMDMPYKVHMSKDVNPDAEDLFAVTRGPIVLCADSCETDLYKAYAIQMQDRYAQVEKTDDGYVMSLANGETLTLREYAKTGKNYYAPREMSVWLRKKI